ncbi:glutaredoxin family protein [Litoribrevibacter albus]|uniref:Thioredoxin family protein n=1 Tax=Litoribrevibacter albus TaxID=1473156 RepID=A0AA37SBW0_9GAMM|nr:glutaredoxin family protein [Litoribrevibacter albus]GLQ31924.1 thioredoxin family protein [Litoribrevibacter albus]
MNHNEPDLILFTTDGCHLCDIASQVIANAIDLEQVYVELVDIAEEPEADQLIEDYGTRLPVVKHLASDREIDWPFDSPTFAKWFDVVSR